MKKVLLVVMVLVLSLAFVGCGSSYGKIKTAFENAGYVESEEFEELINEIKTELDKEDAKVNIHYLYNKSKFYSATVIEFNNVNDIKAQLEKSDSAYADMLKDFMSSDDAKELYQAAVDKGIVNGNCLLVPGAITPKGIQEIIDVFKNA